MEFAPHDPPDSSRPSGTPRPRGGIRRPDPDPTPRQVVAGLLDRVGVGTFHARPGPIVAVGAIAVLSALLLLDRGGGTVAEVALPRATVVGPAVADGPGHGAEQARAESPRAPLDQSDRGDAPEPEGGNPSEGASLDDPWDETTAPAPANSVVVHVSGAVARPGVVELSDGARVSDAVDRAGGPAESADMARVNLAAVAVDATRIHIPHVGSTVPSVVAPETGAVPVFRTDGDAAAGRPAVVSLNSATAADLEALPGVGPVTAGSILALRDELGGFTRLDQLLDVSGIGPARFADLELLVSL